MVFTFRKGRNCCFQSSQNLIELENIILCEIYYTPNGADVKEIERTNCVGDKFLAPGPESG